MGGAQSGIRMVPARLNARCAMVATECVATGADWMAGATTWGRMMRRIRNREGQNRPAKSAIGWAGGFPARIGLRNGSWANQTVYQFSSRVGTRPIAVRRFSARSGRGLTTGRGRNRHCVFFGQIASIGYLQRELQRCVLGEAVGAVKVGFSAPVSGSVILGSPDCAHRQVGQSSPS